MLPPISAEMATQIYAICTVILTVKMLALAIATARVRKRHKLTLVSEDARGAIQLADIDPPDSLRIKRVHLNDIENVPLFLIVGGLALWMGVAALPAIVCFVAFTLARAHSTRSSTSPGCRVGERDSTFWEQRRPSRCARLSSVACLPEVSGNDAYSHLTTASSSMATAVAAATVSTAVAAVEAAASTVHSRYSVAAAMESARVAAPPDGPDPAVASMRITPVKGGRNAVPIPGMVPVIAPPTSIAMEGIARADVVVAVVPTKAIGSKAAIVRGGSPAPDPRCGQPVPAVAGVIGVGVRIGVHRIRLVGVARTVGHPDPTVLPGVDPLP